MDNFAKYMKKGKNLEDTVMLMMIWNKTRELNRDWVLKDRTMYPQAQTLEYVLDISKLNLFILYYFLNFTILNIIFKKIFQITMMNLKNLILETKN